MATQCRAACRALSSLAALPPLSKEDASKILLGAKEKSSLTFKELSDKLRVNKLWLTAALHGEHPINKELSSRLIEALNIPASPDERRSLVEALGRFAASRGAANNARDPAVRRLQELVDVYGQSVKALIHEEAGDGIMSAIDCTIQLDKVTVKNGGGQEEVRIVITIDGKFLPYKVDHVRESTQ